MTIEQNDGDDELPVLLTEQPRQWSGQQQAIFDFFKSGRGHAAVIARAGTGKTTTIQEALQYAPEAKRIYLAFNKRNVKEAQAKIVDGTEVKTLHSLGFRFVLRQWPGSQPDEDVEKDRVKAECRGASFRHLSTTPYSAILDLVSWAKNTKPLAVEADMPDLFEASGAEINDRSEQEGWTVELVCKAAYNVLLASKTRDPQKRISFDDMLWLPVVMRWAAPWFQLVVVDEAQDMNATQLILAQRACRAGGRIILVGDPRQAIYGFRGADVGGMDRLISELKCTVFSLTTTYRCPKAVVSLASKLVPDYQAAPSAPEGEVKAVAGDVLTTTIQPGDVILSRTNAPLMRECLALLRSKKRAYIEGRDIGRRLTALAEKIANGNDSVPLFVTNLQGYKAKKCEALIARQDKASEKAMEELSDTVETLLALAEESATVSALRSQLSYLFEDSNGEPRPEKVALSTVHKAKGLEWTSTYILRDTFRDLSMLPIVSEEANLLYVAVTRAKRTMTWVTGVGGPKKKVDGK